MDESFREEDKTIIKDNYMALCTCLDVSHPLFWDKLRTGRDAGIGRKIEEIQPAKSPLYEQKGQLLDFITRRSRDFYECFLRALVETNQGFLLQLLGKNVADYDPEIRDLPPDIACCLEIWDRRNLGEQAPVYKDETLRTTLQKHRSLITEKLRVAELWSTLLKLHVVDKYTQERIEHNAIEIRQAGQLMDYIETGPRWRYHGFSKAVLQTEQDEVIKALNLEREKYKVQPRGVGEFQVGDVIKVKPDMSVEEHKELQTGHGGWNKIMKSYIGRIGTVFKVDSDGDTHVRFGSRIEFLYNPLVLIKTDDRPIGLGDKVKVSTDRKKVEELQSGHGGWVTSMKKILGKTGVVIEVDDDEDISVYIDGQAWELNPLNCTVEAHADPAKQDTALLDMLRSYTTKGKRTIDPDRLLGEAAQGHLKNVEAILERHRDCVNKKDSQGHTALQAAAHGGHVDVMKALLEAGAELEILDEDGDTAAQFAIVGRRAEALELLLSRGAKVDVMDNKGRHTLLVAVHKKTEECVRVLLNHGAQVNLQDLHGDTPIFDAISMDQTAIVRLLAAHPKLDYHFKNMRGFTPIHHAGIHGNQEVMEVLLEHGKHLVNVQKEDGFTPLHLAANNNHVDVARTLITKGGADMERQTYNKQTPLLVAVHQGYLNMVRLLLEQGANTNVQDSDGDTSLHQAIMRWMFTQSGLAGKADKMEDDVAMVTLLCEHGADLYRKNGKGVSPIDMISDEAFREKLVQLHQQAPKRVVKARKQSSNEEVCQVKEKKSNEEVPVECVTVEGAANLLGAASVEGAPSLKGSGSLPVNEATKPGPAERMNSLHLALHTNNKVAAKSLLSSSPKLAKERTECGSTCLHLAVKSGNMEIIKLILDEDLPQVKQRDSAGHTPLHLALKRETLQMDVVELMLQLGAEPNVTDKHGNNCLHHLFYRKLEGGDEARSMMLGQALLLVDYGANPSMRNHEGKRPVDLTTDVFMREALVGLDQPTSPDPDPVDPSQAATNQTTPDPDLVEPSQVARTEAALVTQEPLNQAPNNQKTPGEPRPAPAIQGQTSTIEQVPPPRHAPTTGAAPDQSTTQQKTMTDTDSLHTDLAEVFASSLLSSTAPAAPAAAPDLTNTAPAAPDLTNTAPDGTNTAPDLTNNPAPAPTVSDMLTAKPPAMSTGAKARPDRSRTPRPKLHRQGSSVDDRKCSNEEISFPLIVGTLPGNMETLVSSPETLVSSPVRGEVGGAGSRCPVRGEVGGAGSRCRVCDETIVDRSSLLACGHLVVSRLCLLTTPRLRLCTVCKAEIEVSSEWRTTPPGEDVLVVRELAERTARLEEECRVMTSSMLRLSRAVEKVAGLSMRLLRQQTQIMMVEEERGRDDQETINMGQGMGEEERRRRRNGQVAISQRLEATNIAEVPNTQEVTERLGANNIPESLGHQEETDIELKESYHRQEATKKEAGGNEQEGTKTCRVEGTDSLKLTDRLETIGQQQVTETKQIIDGLEGNKLEATGGQEVIDRQEAIGIKLVTEPETTSRLEVTERVETRRQEATKRQETTPRLEVTERVETRRQEATKRQETTSRLEVTERVETRRQEATKRQEATPRLEVTERVETKRQEDTKRQEADKLGGQDATRRQEATDSEE